MYFISLCNKNHFLSGKIFILKISLIDILLIDICIHKCTFIYRFYNMSNKNIEIHFLMIFKNLDFL